MVEAANRSKVALVVCDGKQGPTATQMISFGQPFANAPDSPFGIHFERNHTDAAEVEAAFNANHPDLIVLSRCTSPLGQEWIRLARDVNLPVIFHIDDDLLAVPESLGASKFKAYNSPERLQALRDNIEGSDLLYVSTAELEKRFREHGIAAPIVAGDVYCAVAQDEIGALTAPATGPVIGYMGTAGHSADLLMVMPAICEVMDLIPSLQFEVFGTIKMPVELERFGNRARHIPPVPDYTQFLPFLRSLGWWIGLAPLEDNSFNRCKADTKWVEYSLAGMAVVASDLPVYHRACADGAGILASSHVQWSDALQQLIYRPNVRQRMVQASQAKLRQAYTHEKLRGQVLRLFDRVLGARTLQ
jgi:glycosyltransferase involved in cell wall biosynthesis